MKPTQLHFYILTLGLLLIAPGLRATVYNTIGDGSWSDPTIWSEGTVPPSPLGATDSVFVNDAVTGTDNIIVMAGGQLNIEQDGYLDLTGYSLFNFSNGGGASLGGVNVFGTLVSSYVRNYGFAWIFIEPSGSMHVFGDVDNLGDIYVSGLLEVTNGDFNHLAADIWIYQAGNISISNGDFNNHSTIRNLFPNSCVRVLDGSFVNEAGGVVAGDGGVTADIDVDNSANPMANWIGITWCAGQNGVNVPVDLEDCENAPCSSPLEVNVASFEAVPLGNGTVRVEWATASEIGSSAFLVERSHDLEEFELVREMVAAGESGTISRYEILDEENGGGMLYYRLTEIDMNGNATVHKQIASAFVELEEQVFVMYPNPSVGTLQVQLGMQGEDAAEISIHGMSGALVIKKEMKSAKEELDLSSLPAGIYTVTIKKGSKLETERLVLE